MLEIKITPDWESLLQCIYRSGNPGRVHHIELYLDPEVQIAIAAQFNLLDGLNPVEPYFQEKRAIRLQRFLGYDFIRQGLEGLEMPLQRITTDDTAALQRSRGRSFVNETRGPISTWHEFESYPWPDPAKASTRALEWYEKNLPEDMCIIAGGGFAHFSEYLIWLMGYQTLCFMLHDDRALVGAIANRLMDYNAQILEQILQFERVKMVWGADDMGFKTGTLISPTDLREFVLPGHRKMSEMTHAAGKPYLLHSCGKLTAIMKDLIDDVKIDARHSFEDVIEDVITAKQRYGSQIALLGGIDIDFLCRARPEGVRSRVRETLDACLPGGGYCLGTGNSVANYIPLENYLTMLDEGRKYSHS